MSDNSKGKLSFSELNSSGEGSVTYSTDAGDIRFEYFGWGRIIEIPTHEQWQIQFASSWAKDFRDEIIQDIIRQKVPKDWPGYELHEGSIVFLK